jgi:hypothetical protein
MSEECRKAFEAWIDPQGRNNYALERDGGGYKLMSTHSYWTAWQAAWSARTPSVEGLVEALEELAEWEPWEGVSDTGGSEHNVWRDQEEIQQVARAALAQYRKTATLKA